MTDFNLIHLFKRPQYGLLSLLACLFGIYLALLWRVKDLAHFGMSVLFLLAAMTLIWENHSTFVYRHERPACLAAVGLMGWIIWQSTGVVSEDYLPLRLFPFLSALAVALLASGFQGLLQYRRELAIMFFLGVPSVLLNLLDISPLTASLASGLLRYSGYDVTQQGVLITSSAGTLEVSSGYSSMENLIYLMGMAVICLTLYPVCRPKQITALLSAFLIGLLGNSVQIAIMATLVAPQDQTAFLYWHEGDGSLILGVLAVALFALFYWLLHQLEMKQRRDNL
jgi:cyanoexosortase A